MILEQLEDIFHTSNKVAKQIEKDPQRLNKQKIVLTQLDRVNKILNQIKEDTD